MSLNRDQKTIALVSLINEFLKVEPQAFCFTTHAKSGSIEYLFDSKKFGVTVSLTLFGENKVVSLDFSFSELSNGVSNDMKPILEQFLQAFRKVVKKFQKLVEFEIYCYGTQELSVTADTIFDILII